MRLDRMLKRKSPEDAVMEYFEIFSKLFFLGLLTKANCPVKMTLKGDKRWDENQNNDIRTGGITSYPLPHTSSEKKCNIEIFEPASIRDPEKQLRWYLRVQAHEMTHAYLNLMVYQCFRKCIDSKITTLDLTGHGLHWQRCTILTEDFLKISFKNFYLTHEIVVHGSRACLHWHRFQPSALEGAP